ncbi:MAG: succinate dehydrogenase [Alphaproteobacteria bacterium]|nr:succinate dehydrogenase [Alphaproteobacteria bacterium]
MANASTGGHVQGLGATMRKDAWWQGPALTAGILSLWLVYYAFAAAQGKYYSAGPYISPFYIAYEHPASVTDMSPGYAWFGFWPDSWPAFFPPALVMGALPGMFRMTCYYYRKAYYRSFFGMPPGCAVGPVPHDYRGETFLLVFQNLHRYTLYIAIALLPLLYLDAIKGLWYDGRPGIGLGTVLLGANAVLLTGYTLGCHAWRHLVGGKLNCFSCDGASEARHGLWGRVTWLNERHQQFAWSSLIMIAICDIYIRSVSMGVIPDINTWSGVTWIGDFH